VKIVSSSFVASAYKPSDEPNRPGPEIVFLGRSNVGKSSMINRLLGTRNLARTSSTPGRTQSVNYYRINDRFWFIDLPGYGFAKVPREVREGWGPMVERFLQRKKDGIALAVLLVDARHDPTGMDRTMGEWLEAAGIRYLVVGTKADKLSGNGRSRSAKTIRETFEETACMAGCVLASSKNGLGIREIWKRLDQVLGVE
jgi:GTP-binding protein